MKRRKVLRGIVMPGFLVGLFFFFCVDASKRVEGGSKKVVYQGVATATDFFTANLDTEKERVKHSGSRSVPQQKRKFHATSEGVGCSDLKEKMWDVPQTLDAAGVLFWSYQSEFHYECFSHQILPELSTFYHNELQRLGWEVEYLSQHQKIILLGSKPLKSVLIILEELRGGWFSNTKQKVSIIIKER